jgi:hypothetical protein
MALILFVPTTVTECWSVLGKDWEWLPLDQIHQVFDRAMTASCVPSVRAHLHWVKERACSMWQLHAIQVSCTTPEERAISILVDKQCALYHVSIAAEVCAQVKALFAGRRARHGVMGILNERGRTVARLACEVFEAVFLLLDKTAGAWTTSTRARRRLVERINLFSDCYEFRHLVPDALARIQ